MNERTMDNKPMDDLPITDTMIANARPMTAAKRARIVSGRSQTEFARDFGIPLGTLRHWEQGRAEPDVTALSYLKAITADPEAVASAFAKAVT